MHKIFLISAIWLLFLASCENLPRGVQKLQTKHQLLVPQQIEVLEFIWLGCSACKNFHKNWAGLKKQFAGKKVVFRSVPAMFENWKFDARVYAAMEELGVADDGLLANYYKVRQGPKRNEFAQDKQVIAQWLEQRYGTRAQDYLDVFSSAAVTEKLQYFQELVEKYPVTGVPVLLVSVPSGKVSYLVEYSQTAAETVRELLTAALSK